MGLFFLTYLSITWMFTSFFHPKALYFISFGELCERLSFYGMQNILVLYLVHMFKTPDTIGFAVYGAFVTFAFALPILGGVIADRWLGYHRSLFIGAILLIAGNLIATIPNFYAFCTGLAVIVTGIGFYKPNSTTLVGQLYRPEDQRRESGYTLFYLAMNIGATISVIFYGLITQWFGWNKTFIFSALLILLAINLLLRFLPKNQRYINTSKKSSDKTKLIYLILPIFIAFVTALIIHPAFMQYFVLLLISIIGISLIISIKKYTRVERHHIAAILILNTFGIFFFAASLLVGSSINLFIARDMNHTLGNWVIPTIMFTSLYPLAVILMAPILTPFWQYLARKKREPSAPIKLAIGLIFACLGFICFTLAAKLSWQQPQTHLNLIYIVLGNLCLGTGELALTPAVMSTISRLAPLKMQATLMGTWFLFIALGGYLSSFLGRLTLHNQTILNAAAYQNSFYQVAMVCGGIAICLLLITPWLKKLMQPKPFTQESSKEIQLNERI